MVFFLTVFNHSRVGNLMHSYLFKIPKSLLSSIRLSPVLLLVMVFALVSTPSFAKLAAAATPVIGQVSLLIGDTLVTGPNRKGSVRLQAGADIYPSDIIQTRASGHAHLRFIDGALMSVRPSSRLTIEAYNYDPIIPANNRVSFKLEEGIARSISGKAAKDARENFRMNTPVAAIGVRGTDFIVHTSPERTRALVTEGGIVLSGLDAVCMGSSCGGLELRGGSQQLLEMDLATNQPRLMRSSFDEVLTSTALNSNMALVQVQAVQDGLLAEHKVVVPVVAEEASVAVAPVSTATENKSNSKPEPVVAAVKPAPSDNQTADNPTTGAGVDSVVANTSATDTSVSDTPVSNASVSDTSVANTSVADNQVAVADTSISDASIADNQVAANTASDTKGKGSLINNEIITPSDLLIKPEIPEIVISTALVWGYLDTNNDALPAFVQTQDTIATLENKYHNTNIANAAYALHRRNEYNQEMNQYLPELQFALNDAAAWLSWGGYREAMDVGEGMLSINFNTGLFSTQLQLNHERTGQIFFNTSGTTSNTGHFVSQGSHHKLEGITSLNGKEAAYLFEKKLLRVEDVIDGITHWGVKK